MLIESPQNEKIKHLSRLLTDNRFRKKSGVFVVEGQQENERALKFGHKSIEYFICEDLFPGTPPQGKTHFISRRLYEKLAYRGSSEGILGIYLAEETPLENYTPDDSACIMVIESVEKPGNLGAILRSCEAFGVAALIVTDPKVDFYNPNVIRSSVGCLFGMNVFQSNNEVAFEFLKQHGFMLYTTFMDEAAQPLFEKDFSGKSALLFGTEHSGLSSFWLGKGSNITVPMSGSIDSLNLSNAVAICCYEVLRQKLRT